MWPRPVPSASEPRADVLPRWVRSLDDYRSWFAEQLDFSGARLEDTALASAPIPTRRSISPTSCRRSSSSWSEAPPVEAFQSDVVGGGSWLLCRTLEPRQRWPIRRPSTGQQLSARTPASLRSVRPIDSPPVEAPFVTHSGQNCGRRTIQPALRAGRASEKTNMPLRRQFPHFSKGRRSVVVTCSLHALTSLSHCAASEITKLGALCELGLRESLRFAGGLRESRRRYPPPNSSRHNHNRPRSRT
jgi:hypothetical protein